MIKVTKDMTQIFVTKDGAYTLRKELEDAFVVMDVKTTKGCYSMKHIYKISPKLAELYSTLGK